MNPVIHYRGWYIHDSDSAGNCWIDRDGEEPYDCGMVETAYRIIDAKMDGRSSLRRAIAALTAWRRR